MLKRALLLLVILLVSLIQGSCIRSAWSGVTEGTIDFPALYGTALAVHRGGSPVYDPKTIHGVDVGLDAAHPHPAIKSPENRTDSLHPPFEVLLFLPLTWLPYLKAYLVWTICNIVFEWLALLALWRFLPNIQPDFEFVAILYGFTLPIVVCLLQGQDSILLLLLICLSFACLAGGRDLAAGVFLALGLFKFHLVLPLVAVLVVMRNWRAIRAFAYGFAGVLAATFAVVGPRNTLRYIPYIFRFGQHISSNGSQRTVMMPNLRGLISMLASHSATRTQSMLVVALSLGLFFLLIGWIVKFPTLPIATQFSCAVAVTSLISYHYYVYNAVILAIPLLLMANDFAGNDRDRILRRAYFAIAGSIIVTMLLPPFGVMSLEHAMPLVAMETIGLATILFAIPYRQKRSVDALVERAGA